VSVAGVTSIQFTVALDDPLAQLRKVLVAPRQIVVSGLKTAEGFV
jgi:hypothetical protein